MSSKNKILAGLIMIAVVDWVVPLPIVGILLIYVLLQRPPWFKQMVAQVYGAD
ncbi:MAG: hypothetical protein JRJ12_02805 [Deltaproteobacteria bacterium]|nr:hypothetical protein [Deltaproteobacteria bacterium]MBW2071524.1 hypothetical protein [Deltaproteobacteria bacterium]